MPKIELWKEDFAGVGTLADDVHARGQSSERSVGVGCANQQITSDIVYLSYRRCGGDIIDRSGGVDGQSTCHVGHNETSESGIVVGLSARDSHLCWVRAIVASEVGDEALGERVHIARRYLFGDVVGDRVACDLIVVGEDLYRQFGEVDDRVAVALILLRTIVAHHLGE